MMRCDSIAIGLAMFAIGNSPKSRYGETRISKMTLRTGNNK